MSMQFGWPAPAGPGLFTQTQNLINPNFGSLSHHRSTYRNNSGTSVQFGVDSYLPTANTSTSDKALEMPNYQFLGALNGLNQGGAIDLPFNGLGEYVSNQYLNPTPQGLLDSWAKYFLSNILFPQRPYNA